LSKIIKLLELLNRKKLSSPPMLVYLRMLLPRSISFQIKSTIAKSIKMSWLKKSDKNEIIYYKKDIRPILLHTLSLYNYNTRFKSNTVFFKKNDAIYVKTYNNANKIFLILYDYISEGYGLLEIDSSQFHSINEYVKNSNGDLCLLYEGKTKGIYNFNSQKIIYETDSVSFWSITYPLANSIGIVLRRDNDWKNIYIDIVNLLNADKYEISYPIRDHLRGLLKDYLQKLAKDDPETLMSSVESKKHKKYIEKLITQDSIESLSFEEKFIPSKLNYYVLDVASGKVVFCKSLTIRVDMRYTISSGKLSLETQNAFVIRCSMEENGVAITIGTGDSNRLAIQGTYIDIDMPTRTLLSRKYRMEIPKDLSNSCLYAVSDLFDNYVILENEIGKLPANTDNKDYSSREYGMLNNLLRVGSTSIYEIYDDSGKKFLVRFRSKSSDKVRKLGTVVLNNSSYKVSVLNLDRLYDILSANQDKNDVRNRQYIDATEYEMEADAWSLIVSKVKTGDPCGGANNSIRDHKIYFCEKTSDFYLFLYTIRHYATNANYSLCVSVYKYEPNRSKIKWRKVLTLGPYENNTPEIPPNNLLSILTKDLAFAGYNILLYPNFLYKLAEGKDEIGKIFIYKGEISFEFEDTDSENVYTTIFDTTYNRQNNFMSNKYNENAISNIKQDDGFILCFDKQGKRIVCSPLIVSEMELVKAIPLIA
jgi:hypothetical protein